VEAFGPVSTLMPYDDLDEALALAARGRGSLVASLVTRTPAVAARAIPVAAAWHGRLLVLDRECAPESTGHGSPLPQLKHGGPGRAGGGEELGGSRAVKHYLQRVPVQGSPTMLAAVVGEHVRGAQVRESGIHPSVTTSRTCRSATRWPPIAAPSPRPTSSISAASRATTSTCTSTTSRRASRPSASASRTATSCSAAAGLFVSPAPGPVLANYGLDTLRFVKPVGIGDTISARLTCKRKIDRNKKDANGQGQGVVAWDVEVSNQDGELVASTTS
jgi:oxepin-CoA hydrolase/3-oxo-5,6-dehydrosuberyl-CoA semialdehyde dehydrogenase